MKKNDAGNGADDFRIDPRLATVYEEAVRQDDEVFETVCPLFVDLCGVGERYTDETLLGKGGLKEVYRAYDQRTHRWVALARLREDRGLQFYDLFVREAWLIASLSHPNIIKVFDAGVDDVGRPFFTMDLKGGTTLADRLAAAPPDSLAELLELFLKICDAMAYAHSNGVLHLDLKPENIQCDRFGEVMVCDWGLGSPVAGSAPAEDDDVFQLRSVENVTLMGHFKGSPGYMAPEQVTPGLDKDPRTDVYALGCILHTLLCGEPPFSGPLKNVLADTKNSRVPPLQARFPDRRIPTGLEAVVLKATARKPEKRYDSVALLRQEIHNYLSGFATRAEQPGFFKEARLFLMRNRIPAAITMGSLVLLSILSVLFVQHLGRQQMATEEERKRADSLLMEVNVLSSDYQTLFEEASVSKKELAGQLVLAAHSLKNMGIFERPVSAVEQAQQLVAMALHLDPECAAARWERFYLYCLTLNYHEALADSTIPAATAREGLGALARAFPEYSFSREALPSADQIAAVYRWAEANWEAGGGYLERTFAYYRTVAKGAGEPEVGLAALLGCLNGGEAHVGLSYVYKQSAMTVWTDREDVRLRVRSDGGECLLRFIPVRTLKVEATGCLNVKELNGLKIRILDLRECREVVLDGERLVRLPYLQTVLLRPGQVSSAALRHRIRSNEPFEIVQ